MSMIIARRISFQNFLLTLTDNAIKSAINDPAIFTRGQVYQRQGFVFDVSWVETDPTTVRAIVQRETPYNVEVFEEKNMIYAHCDCDYVSKYGQPCKHIAALLLEIKQEKMARHWFLKNDDGVVAKKAPRPQVNFLELTSFEEALILLICANTAPDGISETKITNFLNYIGKNDWQVSDKDCKQILKKLKDLGYVVKGLHYYFQDSFNESKLHQVLKTGAAVLPEVMRGLLSHAVAQENSHRNASGFYFYEDQSFKITRRLRLAAYLGDQSAFEDAVSDWMSTYKPEQMALHIFPKVELDVAWLLQQPYWVLSVFFDCALMSHLLSLDLPQPLPRFIRDFSCNYPGEGDYYGAMVLMAALKNDQEWLTQLTKSPKPDTATNAAAWQALLTGQYELALKYAEVAVKAVNKIHNGKRGLPIHSATLVLHLSSLVNNSSPDTLKPVREDDGPLAKILRFYDNLIRPWLLAQKAQAIEAVYQGQELSDVAKVFKALYTFWIDQSLLDGKYQHNLWKKLEPTDLEWLKSELLHLLLALDVPVETDMDIAAKQPESDVRPMVEWLKQTDEWELALDALVRTISGASDNIPKEKSARLIWLIDFEREILLPKEQNFSKGAWTGGRNVALKRLVEGDLASMTAQDHRVVRAIKQNWNGYEIDFEEAVVALPGHPLLFLEKSPGVSVQLIEHRPSLVVTPRGDNRFKVQFNFEYEPDQDYVIEKETPTRYKLFQISKDLHRIAGILGDDGIEVPAQGRDKLVETVRKISGTVSVLSSLEEMAEEAASVEPDSRIRLHILPGGDGFYVELYVKPLGEIPPYFKPGQGESLVFGLTTVTDEQNGSKMARVCARRNHELEITNAAAVVAQVPLLQQFEPDAADTRYLENREDCLEFLSQIDPLVASGEIVIEWPKGEKFRVSRVVDLQNLKVRVNSGKDWFSVEGEVQIDENHVMKLGELMLLLEQGKSDFIELSPGKFVALTQRLRKQLRQLGGMTWTDKKTGEQRFHHLAASAMEEFAELTGSFEYDKKWEENKRRIAGLADLTYKLPSGVQAELRDYQREGYTWLRRLADWGVGACLADDMGLGKTLQVLTVLLSRKKEGPALVVAPASVVRNWLSETARFTPELNAQLFGEEGDRISTVKNAKAGDIVVVTYNLLQRESELFSEKSFATVVLDEAQAIKNANTKRSETAMNLNAGLRIITTGTPLENHLGELWNLFQFINPGLLGTADQFMDRFSIPIERDKDEARREQLRRIIRPFVLRRLKSDVLKELPPKTEITLTVEMSTEETAFYEQIRRSAIDHLSNNQPDNSGTQHLRILAEIMRLRQAACNPRLVDSKLHIPSSKLALFESVLEELLENNHRALVFSQFVEHLKLIRESLDKRNIKYHYLDGSTPIKKRQEAIEAFQRGEGEVFLISLRAGGSGINLTGADYVIHMDPWWNPAVEDQATDRAHRIGQERPVTVYRLVTANTIEEKIVKLHEHKRDLADSLLSGADTGARLNADDLLALLRER